MNKPESGETVPPHMTYGQAFGRIEAWRNQLASYLNNLERQLIEAGEHTALTGKKSVAASSYLRIGLCIN
ncbi:hypothetical protein A2154_05120 [Candidatus Gottesmanbacteria bacterium RBG_16_43_7]|uniref:Uncharacterized protein n=1 Tax=Candidatus Gottesmanbacteria bacterium RBG_16_43_7 TaxID=1798373 RepID=A0A1F5ZCZ8_9BACT|nr:MAG: hypothetical protein A2154_05120 [Candidatus Gottesmanbacteria bacterium RBG_16_43_7]